MVLEELLRLPGTVLLESARRTDEDKHQLLFTDPLRTIACYVPQGLDEAFGTVDEALSAGMWVAGFVAYEAGHFLCLDESQGVRSDSPLLWFGVYEAPAHLDTVNLPEATPSPVVLEHALPFADYEQRIDKIKSYIRAGDTYQINFTYPLLFPAPDNPVGTYASLRKNQKVPYSAFLNLGNSRFVLSFSPELFFRKDGSTITTRPMKGTSKRGRTAQEDETLAADLQSDEKNRAENLMIVDLLRNDLSKIARPNTVEVKSLFETDVFESVIQMSSTVCAEVDPKIEIAQVFNALFPCGSVTGAPKIRSMEIIRELEKEKRSVYCGAIGYARPDGDSVFSVAIRTIEMDDLHARMSTGSGIVWDSDANQEYHECATKAAFLERTLADTPTSFSLIETILYDGRLQKLGEHEARIRQSSVYFGIPFDEKEFTRALERVVSGLGHGRYRIRLLLGQDGKFSAESTLLEDDRLNWSIVVSSQIADSSDAFLFHKTTIRDIYDSALVEAQQRGADEAILVNERGELTEGSRTNVFIRHEGVWKTPAQSCGLLAGIQRAETIREFDAQETIITPTDLFSADEIILTNSIRGKIRAHLLSPSL